MVMPERKRLSADDWTAAALEALATGGVGAVAVEPLAAQLGTTKGSFYWHFSGRDALLAAALERWERVDTSEVIAMVETEPEPGRRLHALLSGAINPGRARPPIGAVELALQSGTEHPLVAPALARVTRRRLDYLTTAFVDLGFPAEPARRRALLAYTAYLGHAQLARATPDEVPRGPDLVAYVAEVVAVLTG